jgi:hypothetical protein
MATSNFLFTTLAGTETAGYTSINTIISSIDTQLNKRVPNKDSSGTGAYDGMVPMYSNAAASGFTQGLIDAANIASDAITEAKIATGAVTNTKIANNAVTLGTQTTGDYVASITAGGTNEIATTGTGEGAAATVRLADNTALRGAATVGTPPTYSGGSTGTVGRIPDAKYVTDALAYATAGNITLTGDVTVSGGTATIGSGAVTSAKILDGTIVNGDINTSAAIAYSKLNLTGAVLNADLAGSIAYAKLATDAKTYSVASSATTGTYFTASGDFTSASLSSASTQAPFVIANHASTAITLSLPTGIGSIGDTITVCQYGAATTTISPKSGAAATINGSTTVTYLMGGQYSLITLVCVAANTWVITGDYY